MRSDAFACLRGVPGRHDVPIRVLVAGYAAEHSLDEAAQVNSLLRGTASEELIEHIYKTVVARWPMAPQPATPRFAAWLRVWLRAYLADAECLDKNHDAVLHWYNAACESIVGFKPAVGLIGSGSASASKVRSVAAAEMEAAVVLIDQNVARQAKAALQAAAKDTKLKKEQAKQARIAKKQADKQASAQRNKDAAARLQELNSDAAARDAAARRQAEKNASLRGDAAIAASAQLLSRNKRLHGGGGDATPAKQRRLQRRGGNDDDNDDNDNDDNDNDDNDDDD